MDRLAKLAETLEEQILSGTETQQQNDNIENRIHNLERIITAVQKMMDTNNNGSVNIKNDENLLKNNTIEVFILS